MINCKIVVILAEKFKDIIEKIINDLAKEIENFDAFKAIQEDAKKLAKTIIEQIDINIDTLIVMLVKEFKAFPKEYWNDEQIVITIKCGKVNSRQRAKFLVQKESNEITIHVTFDEDSENRPNAVNEELEELNRMGFVVKDIIGIFKTFKTTNDDEAMMLAIKIINKNFNFKEYLTKHDKKSFSFRKIYRHDIKEHFWELFKKVVFRIQSDLIFKIEDIKLTKKHKHEIRRLLCGLENHRHLIMEKSPDSAKEEKTPSDPAEEKHKSSDPANGAQQSPDPAEEEHQSSDSAKGAQQSSEPAEEEHQSSDTTKGAQQQTKK
ncbi:hypothetical protein F8M41_025836 [Gigaspora margarita]|uniref:Uncharacterized protein n=1 Tax=Gigaspora margarita TaxID=4874 RepID=A0A8H3XHU4_GIGMA|nr:hypothetical protein F8M41_025836 [Gigaspora margarita]